MGAKEGAGGGQNGDQDIADSHLSDVLILHFPPGEERERAAYAATYRLPTAPPSL